MPFCSPRCQLADLHRWMNHEIGLPHYASEDEEELDSHETVREWRFDDEEEE